MALRILDRLEKLANGQDDEDQDDGDDDDPGQTHIKIVQKKQEQIGYFHIIALKCEESELYL